MKRSLIISDWFYRAAHTVKRNRFYVIVYVLLCLLFLVVGIAVGVNVGDKTAYVLGNGAPIYKYLRGDGGIFSYFFIELLFSAIYCAIASSVFFFKPLALLSVVPCGYRTYVLGMNVSIIVSVYSVSALPMLFVLYVPLGIVEAAVMCVLSFRCFAFVDLNGGCLPSKADLKTYYLVTAQYFIIVAGCITVKSLTVVLFGSALVGIL